MKTNTEIAFVRILVPLMIGIYFFYPLKEPYHLQFACIITAFLFLVLSVINIFYRKFKAYRFKYITGIGLSLFFVAFGGFICLFKKDTLKSNYFVRCPGKELKVWINDEPQITNGIVRFTSNVTEVFNGNKSRQTNGKLLILVRTDSLDPIHLSYGDELIINANYVTVAPPYNPAQFDFKGWLESKNSYQQAFIKQKQIVKTGLNKGNALIRFAFTLRQQQVETYGKIIKNKEAFAVASTLILGYRADLSDDTLAAYSKTGTIHALSVSGMHVGIIYIVLNWVLGFLDKNMRCRILKVTIICVLIWSYSLLTGLSPSILRSAIMLTVYILAKSLNKHTNGYNILAFTAFCLLVYDPFLIRDVGFQLSFLAVLGLIYLHPKIYGWFYFKWQILDWIWSSIALSLAAQITTFPLSIYYFHQFPLYFILSNLFILIPITLLMYLGIAILLLKLYFLAPIFEWMIIFMNNGLKWIADLPFSGVNQIWISKIELMILGLALSLGLISVSKFNKRLFMMSVSLLLCLQLSITSGTLISKRQRKILFFTLQKGYAAAFVSRQEAYLVTNVTARDRDFTFAIQPALDQLKIRNIHFIGWENDLSLNFLLKKHHQIKFYNRNILLIDSHFNNRVITKPPAFDLIWLSQNPKVRIEALRRSVIFKSLIIDASNKPFNIKNYVYQANKIQIQSQVLKKNKAYLIDLNHMSK